MVEKAHIGLLRVELSGNDLFRVSTVRAERGLDYPYSFFCSFGKDEFLINNT